MANESVVQDVMKAALRSDRITQPDYIYSEKDPLERIATRLEGLKGLSDLAYFMEESDGTNANAQRLWYFVGLVTEDAKRDLYQLRQDHVA